MSPDGKRVARVLGGSVVEIVYADACNVPRPTATPAESREYHLRLANTAAGDKRGFAEAFHSGRILRAAPGDVDVKKRHADALRRHEESKRSANRSDMMPPAE